jgi:methionyl-tRNA formyltransferase
MEIRTVFMGSPDFALPTLKNLNKAFNVVGVVTQPDRPAGRGRKMQSSEVKILAKRLGLPLIQPLSLKEESAIERIKTWRPDVIVVAAFGQILRENILNLPPYGCVNVHASLLPRWRGAAPVQAAILYDEVTGVTIMKMDKGLDTGPILSQRKILIPKQITAGKLSDILAQMGADLLVDVLPKYIQGQIQPQLQQESQATYAPRLKKEDGVIDFNQPAEFLARKVRAFHPWPGTYTNFEGKRLKIIKAHADEDAKAQPSKRYIVENKPAFGTVKGVLILDEVQMAGKSQMAAEDFLRGAKDWINSEEDDK